MDTQEQLLKEAEELRKKIEDARFAYYDGEPLMSDQDYDKAYARLKQLESITGFWPSHSPTLRVGVSIPSSLRKVQHSRPMLSLDNVMNEAEALAWARGVPFPVMVEVKLDGIALAVRYEDGKFVEAVTRGDGIYGENVTENARTIRNLPMFLEAPFPKNLEVRGEVVFLTGDFKKLNESRQAAGEELFANPRNAAVGAMKQKDSRECAKRPISFIAYDMMTPQVKYDSQEMKISELHRLGFQVSNIYQLCNNFAEVQQLYKETLECRDNLPYEVDGMVLKVNDIEQQNRLSYSATAPRWAAAYKFPHMSGDSEVLRIDIQVGRTGSLTPVARITPVLVAGATITNVTLHNPDEIKRLKINVGSKVEVARSGDVIPKIVKVYNPDKPWDDSHFDTCPVCHSTTSREHVVPRCTGMDKCSAQRSERLGYFASMMGMKGIGPAFVDQMIEKGLLTNFVDYFQLTLTDLERRGGFGPGQAKNIHDAIKSVEGRLEGRHLLAAIGLHGLSSSTADKICAAHNLRSIVANADFPVTAGVSVVARKSFQEYFADLHARQRFILMLDILEASAAAGGAPVPPASSSNKLAGKSFCFTGKLSNTRGHFQQLVRDNGGIVFDSVKAGLDYLVVGDKAGSKKADAQKKGINCIDEATFMGMI